jgi:hypothetical protein
VEWKLVDEQNRAFENGTFDKSISYQPGAVYPVGDIVVDLERCRLAKKLTLFVSITGTEYSNSWDIWVYPTQQRKAPPDIHMTNELDDKAMAVLSDGGKVLLLTSDSSVKGDVEIGFSSIFWNTAWTGGQAPHTLGILCDPAHPALKDFPTEFHSNWQWWDLIHRSQAMVLDAFPPAFRPVVQVIDDWVTNRRLGLLFEAKAAGGKLLVCSMNIEKDLHQRGPALAMRNSILTYMDGEMFDPKHELDIKAVRGLFKKPPWERKDDLAHGMGADHAGLPS